MGSPRALAPGRIDSQSLASDDTHFPQLAGYDSGVGGSGTLGRDQGHRLRERTYVARLCILTDKDHRLSTLPDLSDALGIEDGRPDRDAGIR